MNEAEIRLTCYQMALTVAQKQARTDVEAIADDIFAWVARDTGPAPKRRGRPPKDTTGQP